MAGTAIALTNGFFRTDFAKTTHGLIRGPSRFPLVAVVDHEEAGADAGVLLDGKPRNLPVYGSVAACLEALTERPDYCIVGVATGGGYLPLDLYADLKTAAAAGLTLVNGLHHLLAEEPELVALTQANGGQIIDIRKPKPAKALRFWTGEVLSLAVPRVAVLGTDCAVGKRTTCMLLHQALCAAGLRSEMIYTGQTGWLQGLEHGFIFDATLNDFVSGELERAILACAAATNPDVILLEGQSALRNPSGPAGAELLLSGGVCGVVLQHTPARTYFLDFDHVGCVIPPLSEEIELIRLYGAEVWAITLNTEGMSAATARAAQRQLQAEHGLPIILPLDEGLSRAVAAFQAYLG